jgi:hypothetical protein
VAQLQKCFISSKFVRCCLQGKKKHGLDSVHDREIDFVQERFAMDYPHTLDGFIVARLFLQEKSVQIKGISLFQFRSRDELFGLKRAC